MPDNRTEADRALLSLLKLLRAQGYQFVTPTPATHARVLARPSMQRAGALTDVFGWSLPFAPDALEPAMLELMQAAEIVEAEGDLLKSRLRVSTLADNLFLHSAYPTKAKDAVFFGPDSYRFANFLQAEIGEDREEAGSLVVDIGAGSGVGAITAAARRPNADILMTDINPEALRLARINAAFAGIDAETVVTDGLDGIEMSISLAIANPPYIADQAGRAYRDGGDRHGAELSLSLAVAAADRLAPDGRLLLYTGSAIVGGEDRLRTELAARMHDAGCDMRYRELDPDVFGEELDRPDYSDVDRIAVVGVVVTKRR